MALGTKLLPETLRSLAFGSISSSYMGIGSAFDHPIRLFHLQNLTDEALLFSFDGINDHILLPANGFLLLDITANKSTETGFFIAQGTRIYVKESGVPSSGDVYVTSFYSLEI